MHGLRFCIIRRWREKTVGAAFLSAAYYIQTTGRFLIIHDANETGLWLLSGSEVRRLKSWTRLCEQDDCHGEVTSGIQDEFTAFLKQYAL
jgi:hypothetical protein